MKNNDESIFSLLIKLMVKFGVVALAIYLLLGEGVDWASWRTFAAILLLVGVL